jgi:predicted polyphosphate/ATP-dependent NAD kinase
VIVNPIAGMGGRVGLKGTDGRATLERARRLSAEPVTPTRAARALVPIVSLRDHLRVLSAPGAMGEDVVRAAGFTPELVGPVSLADTGAADTKAAAAAMRRKGADLILFAGGDGTARDLLDAVDRELPVLGIPSGVKMHSAVFATTPENAGEIAAAFLGPNASRVRLRECEVMDIDEEALRQDRVSARLYGHVDVPFLRAHLQGAKANPLASEDDALDAACAELIAEMMPDRLYILGPGTTMRRIKRRLGFPGTLIGVDAVRDRKPVGLDLDEARLLSLLGDHAATIMLGVVGGQGFLLGRGNQQISPEVLRRVGRANIVVVASMAKLMALDPQCLHVDTGDAALDRELAGFMPVHVGAQQRAMVRISAD